MMIREVQYKVMSGDEVLHSSWIPVPFAVGRQSEGGDSNAISVADFSSASDTTGLLAGVKHKLVVVPNNYRSVPRLALLVNMSNTSHITVQNIHRVNEFGLSSGKRLAPMEVVDLGKEGTVTLSDHYRLTISATPKSNPEKPPEEFNFTELRRVNESVQPDARPLVSEADVDGKDFQKIAVQLVTLALEAFKERPGSEEFFIATSNSAIKMIDLDRVAILLKEGKRWKCKTQSFRSEDEKKAKENRGFSPSLLSMMEQNAKTMIVEPQLTLSRSISMIDVDRAVAAPITENGVIVGALYGDRSIGGSSVNRPIGELEAALLEVLARGISTSLTVEREQQMRSSMSQFFSPVVLSELQDNRALLEGKEAKVSVLFCDIRGFSSVTEKIGPIHALNWINDVLTELSQCVLANDGVLVDYIGDELMAMWGAPMDQPDHAVRACKAAREMLEKTEYLQSKWNSIVQCSFSFSVGVNSGQAYVGNTGSKHKFKYGPLGNTVNVASRIQGATKQFGVACIIAGETYQEAIDAGFKTRRLATVRVVGVDAPVELYQLYDQTQPPGLSERYELALQSFERLDLVGAAGRLSTLVQDFPDDRPTIILLSRTVEMLAKNVTDFEPIWNLTEK